MQFKSIVNARRFLSDYWLGSVFAKRGASRGHQITPAQARMLLRRLERLHQIVDGRELDLTSFRERFARPLLREIFGFEIQEILEETRLRPLTVSGDGKTPVACLLFVPEAEGLDGPQSRKLLEKGLSELHLTYGFMVSPDAFRVIRASGIPPKGAYLDFKIGEAVEGNDVDSLLAILRLLHSDNFVKDAEGNIPIQQIEEESREQAEKVSEDLREAVFKSAEFLIGSLLRDAKERSKEKFPLEQGRLEEFRNAALLCLYRLLFILYAEARDEKLQTHPIYHPFYSLETLIHEILRTPLEGQASNRYSHWQRVLSLFRVYDKGLPGSKHFINIPPRGGHLFDQTTPEGQIIANALLDNLSVSRLLRALATAKPRRGIGIERVHFGELGIEQLGSVYEGLLEYEPKIAKGTMIEFKVQGKTFVLEPSELKRLCEEKKLVLVGDENIVRGTVAESLHPELSEAEEDEEEEDENGEEDVEAGGEDEGEEKGIKKGAAAKLLRRFEAGDFYFVPGSSRKSSGSFYTPTAIVDYLVQKALGPLTEGKSAKEIESLRVIDCACGSAHFLVGAGRFLGKKLYSAYKKELKDKPPEEFLHGREAVVTLKEEWEHTGEDWCKRRVIERCLFGVDLNPTAVELAKVALWIESLCGDRPLSFFDHHIRCGNSLLGTWLGNLSNPPLATLDTRKKALTGDGDRTQGLFQDEISSVLKERIKQSSALRLQIDVPFDKRSKIDTIDEVQHKERLSKDAEKLLAESRLLFDLRSASAFVPKIWEEWWDLVSEAEQGKLEQYSRGRKWWTEFEKVCQREKFFHWELEYPEVFASGNYGFDAVMGNPPWDKILPNRHEFYGKYDVLIRAFKGGELDTRIRELTHAMPFLPTAFEEYVNQVNTTARALKTGGDFKFHEWQLEDGVSGGHQDAFKYFVERAHQILRKDGRCGYLVPSAIYNNEGCTGLRHLLLERSRVESFFGFENRQKLFPIDSRYKFVCLVYKKESELLKDQEFSAAFMRHEVKELEGGLPEEFSVLIRQSELGKLSPGTLAFLEYRSKRDREIILKMYGLLPGMKPRPLLGDKGPETWSAKFYSEFNMTTDKDLWTNPKTGKLWTPKQICGLNWPEDSSIPFGEVRAAMAKEGFWPLYEGKHIEQFLVDIKPIDRWVSLEAAQKRGGRTPDASPKLVFRDIASNTNERTCLAAVLPAESCSGNTLATLRIEGLDANQAATIMNSFAFDFVTRLKTAGTHLNWTYVSRVVVPFIKDSLPIPVVKTITSASIGGVSSISDYHKSYQSIWEANKAIAVAYGLTAGELEHILSSFTVFTRKRPEFYAYLTKQVQEWKPEGRGRKNAR